MVTAPTRRTFPSILRCPSPSRVRARAAPLQFWRLDQNPAGGCAPSPTAPATRIVDADDRANIDTHAVRSGGGIGVLAETTGLEGTGYFTIRTALKMPGSDRRHPPSGVGPLHHERRAGTRTRARARALTPARSSRCSPDPIRPMPGDDGLRFRPGA